MFLTPSDIKPPNTVESMKYVESWESSYYFQIVILKGLSFFGMIKLQNICSDKMRTQIFPLQNITIYPLTKPSTSHHAMGLIAKSLHR
jgi:hypothetical protein